MCVFKERLLLINSPKHFVSLVKLRCLSSYLICMSEVDLLLLENWIKQVFFEIKKKKAD